LAGGWRVLAAQGPGEQLPVQPHLLPHPIDLYNEAACAQWVAQAVAEHGRIDAAVLLAGGFAMGNLAQTDAASLDAMFKLNFLTAYHLARPLCQHMASQPQGGRLVLVGARPALDPNAGKNLVAYALSKALVLQLAELINAEGQAHGVNASVLVPSIIDTPANRAAMPTADFAQWASPTDLAELLWFTCAGAGRVLRQTVLKAYNGA
jgi:NAD(P)-dependent dehydrogenase (short-subunit alcohol dehydrogenase family)